MNTNKIDYLFITYYQLTNTKKLRVTMQQSDIIVINVKPKLIECPLCGGDITEKNMKKG